MEIVGFGVPVIFNFFLVRPNDFKVAFLDYGSDRVVITCTQQIQSF